MALNIKDEHVHALVRKLASLRGVNQTRAVEDAVGHRLAELASASHRTVADEILALGKDCAGRLDPATLTLDHGELLYDESGLPR